MKKHHCYEMIGSSSVAIYLDYNGIKVIVSSLLPKRSLYQLCSAFLFLIELRHDEMVTSNLKIRYFNIFKELSNTMKWSFFRISREMFSIFHSRVWQTTSNLALWQFLTLSNGITWDAHSVSQFGTAFVKRLTESLIAFLLPSVWCV